MAGEFTFSVGIPTYNRVDDLRRCLESLGRQTYSRFEVVVANGGEKDAVERLCSSITNLAIRVVHQKKKGIVEARNLCWQESPADIVCIIDDDIVVAEGWLEAVREAFLSDEGVGGVSGPTIIPEERRQNRDFARYLDAFSAPNLLWRLIGKVYNSVVLENSARDVGRILKSGTFTPGSNFPEACGLKGLIPVDYLEACHMCYRRQLLRDLGGFDETYEGTGEWNEPDFSFLVRAKGWKLVFNPRAVTYHCISQAGVFKARTYSYERSRNFILFYKRWIKANTLEKAARFGCNLAFINAYWLFKFLQSGNADWLGGIWGTVTGLARPAAARRSA